MPSESYRLIQAPVVAHPNEFGRVLVPTAFDVTLHGLAGEVVPLPEEAVPANDFADDDGPTFTIYLNQTDATLCYLVDHAADAPNAGFVCTIRLDRAWGALHLNLPLIAEAIRASLSPAEGKPNA